MEEKLLIKLLNTKEAFKSLEVAVRFYTQELGKLALADNLELKKITRDSMIQRFEYTVELSWKLIHEFIQQRHKLVLATSPKVVFKECLKLRLLDDEEVEESIRMVDDRNLTSHTYKEETANQIAQAIPTYLKLLKKIITEIEQNI